MGHPAFMAHAKNVEARLRAALSEAWPPTVAFINWAERINQTPAETPTAGLRDQLDLSKDDVKDLIDGIVELKLGQFIVGRKGALSRIRWHYSLQSIAAVAKGNLRQLSPIAQHIAPGPRLMEHSFRLRPDQSVVFRLPEDFSAAEADRLAKFIQALPFTD